MDAHWNAHHKATCSYKEFKAGLCESHSNGRPVSAAPVSAKGAPPSPNNNYSGALSQRSSHVENLLTHALIAKIGQELWRRNPWGDFQVFKTDVDDAGFDLVLVSEHRMRYVQIKQTHSHGKAVKYSLRLDFAEMPGAVAIVVLFDGNSLEANQYLFYGRKPGEPMLGIKGNKITVSPGRRGADGTRKMRENYRDIPRREFDGPLSVGALVDKLFPSEK